MIWSNPSRIVWKCLSLMLLNSKELEWVHLVSLTVKKVQLSVPTTWTGKLFNQSKKRSKVPFIFHSLSIMMPTLLLWVNVGKGLVKTNQMSYSWHLVQVSAVVSSLKVVSCMVYVELLVSLVTSRLTLMIQSNVPVVKKAVLKRLPQQLGSLTSLVVTPMSTKGTLNWKSWSTTVKKWQLKQSLI